MTPHGARHDMPFGATILDQGGVRFRLWAPDVETVTLECVSGDTPDRLAVDASHPMQAEGDGWWAITVPEAGPGTLYRYRLPDGLAVPDPASRRQPFDAHGPSAVIDPTSHAWTDGDWRGRPWHETVLYELHPGTFTPDGTFAGIQARLDHLAALGVTAVELMPVADFPGRWNWGYDGVAMFAPDTAYGTPDDLKRLVEAAHARGLMVFLDVVYNHFGPEGNYLHAYAGSFFDASEHTPWGAAIDFSRPAVRDFYIHNALYWLEEYRFDGLRFDAVHAIVDHQPEHILDELARRVRDHFADTGRHVHLVLENDDNASRFLGPPRARYDAQWNDDYHHIVHHLLTGESHGYYGDYARAPMDRLARCLGSGFDYQGDPSPFRDGQMRGEASTGLPLTAFVNFIQNHDQIGNRAMGDRLTALAPPQAVEAALCLLLLAPQPPMLFMGEEWGSARPFLFHVDFGADLHDAVREGRRGEFAGFPGFSDPAARDSIPDPFAPETQADSRLDWSEAEAPFGRARMSWIRSLLATRQSAVVPLIPTLGNADTRRFADRGLTATWTDGAGRTLVVAANLGPEPVSIPNDARPTGPTLAATPAGAEKALSQGETLPPWSVVWARGT
jgi:1,4-alpha-glucan branching enzyme/maltooligosyltrehalose trehalohydrolase